MQDSLFSLAKLTPKTSIFIKMFSRNYLLFRKRTKLIITLQKFKISQMSWTKFVHFWDKKSNPNENKFTLKQSTTGDIRSSMTEKKPRQRMREQQRRIQAVSMNLTLTRSILPSVCSWHEEDGVVGEHRHCATVSPSSIFPVFDEQ